MDQSCNATGKVVRKPDSKFWFTSGKPVNGVGASGFGTGADSGPGSCPIKQSAKQPGDSSTYTNPNTDSHPNTDSYPYAYSNSNSDGYANPNAASNTNAYPNSDPSPNPNPYNYS